MKQITTTSAIDCSYPLQKRYKYTKEEDDSNGNDELLSTAHIDNGNLLTADIDTPACHEIRGIDLVHREPDTPFVYGDDNLLVDESISRLFESLRQETNGYVLPQRNVSINEEDGLLSDASISELFDSLHYEFSDGDGNVISVSNEDLIVDLSEEVEMIEHQQQINNDTTLAAENAKLKEEVATLRIMIQELQGSAVANTTNGVHQSGRIVSLKAVKPVIKKYYDEHCVEGVLSPEQREKIRQLIKKEHAKLERDHYYANELMTNEQLSSYIYRLTNKYKTNLKSRANELETKKKAILDVILSDLSKNESIIEPGSNEAARVIQGIFVSHLLLYYTGCYCIVHIS